MAIGERINFFRNKRGMTQKYLGMQVGFPEKSADVRSLSMKQGQEAPRQILPQPWQMYWMYHRRLFLYRILIPISV